MMRDSRKKKRISIEMRAFSRLPKERQESIDHLLELNQQAKAD